MPPTWLTIVAWVSLALAFLTAGLILYDIYGRGNHQKMTVMEAVWPITALYFGPLAWWGYRRWGRLNSARYQRQTGAQPEYGEPVSVSVGVSHCGAGCTLGDTSFRFPGAGCSPARRHCSSPRRRGAAAAHADHQPHHGQRARRISRVVAAHPMAIDPMSYEYGHTLATLTGSQLEATFMGGMISHHETAIASSAAAPARSATLPGRSSPARPARWCRCRNG